MPRLRKPFQTIQTENRKEIPSSLLKQARKSGQLNLANRELSEVPTTVWNLNKPPSAEDSNFDAADNERWWDQVDLKKLILASNMLTSLSGDISVFSCLLVLDVHDNKLKEVPAAVGDLKRLEKLDLSHNEIESLPSNFGNLRMLTMLLLQHNQIQTLPSGCDLLDNLQVVDLSHNRLRDLPRDCGSWIRLQKLNLSTNQLTCLPSDICLLHSLSYLDLNCNKLSNLPENFLKLQSLQELYMRNNLLNKIPVLSGCVGLKEVYCGNNNLQNIDVPNFPKSLAVLELRENKLAKVESDITDLKELQRLDLSNNNISSLPPEIGAMEQVKVLNVDGNPMRSIRRDIINKGTQALLKYLRTRIISDSNNEKKATAASHSLPASANMAAVSKRHGIIASKSLDFSKTSWSNEIESTVQEYSVISIESINLSKMALTSFPICICCFSSSVQTLTVSLNKISKLPTEIGSFSSLTHLDLSTNSLYDLPEEMSALQSLIEINLNQNRFTVLPNCLFEMKSLEHLLAGGNQIGEIDATALQKLPVLSTLALQNNNISQVPPQLGLVSSIRSLQLEGNTFRIPRQTIVQQGTLAIMEFLRNRLPNA